MDEGDKGRSEHDRALDTLFEKQARSELDQIVDSLAKQFALDTFVIAIREHNAIAAHPDTLDALRALSEWREAFGGVRLVPFPWAERGRLYAGAIVGECADAEERAQ